MRKINKTLTQKFSILDSSWSYHVDERAEGLHDAPVAERRQLRGNEPSDGRQTETAANEVSRTAPGTVPSPCRDTEAQQSEYGELVCERQLTELLSFRIVRIFLTKATEYESRTKARRLSMFTTPHESRRVRRPSLIYLEVGYSDPFRAPNLSIRKPPVIVPHRYATDMPVVVH